MRVVAGIGISRSDPIVAFLAKTDATIAAIAAISPADACAVADALSLRYAIQCWDVADEGKAIFWKPTIALHGLYRAEFERRLEAPVQRGLLRVTLLWDGRPLDVLCAHLSPVSREADWQLVEVARETSGARGPMLLAIASATVVRNPMPGLIDAASAAPWRAVVLPSARSVGDVARGAFGLGSDTYLEHDAARSTHSVTLRCTPDFSVMRAYDIASAEPGALRSALVVDVAAAPQVANGSDRPHDPADAAHPGRTARTGTYSL